MENGKLFSLSIFNSQFSILNFQFNTTMRLFIAVTLLLLAAGCGSGTVVSGKVTFEDGSPVTKGTAVFDSGAKSYQGTIRPDGSYRMGISKDNQRIPPGRYKVWFANTARIEVRYGRDGNPLEPVQQLIFSQLQPEFTNSARAALTADVNRNGRLKLDFTVQRHPDWDQKQKYGPNGSEGGK
jgi:hypothetical protein